MIIALRSRISVGAQELGFKLSVVIATSARIGVEYAYRRQPKSYVTKKGDRALAHRPNNRHI
jgi:hypothetical protein